MEYRVAKVASCSAGLDWNAAPWTDVSPLKVNQFREESLDHRPVVLCKIVHDGQAVAMLFDVCDQYVRAQEREFQGDVCRDSCVEFFVRPKSGRGYLNFEMNCGGVLHASFIEDWTRVDGGFAKRTMLTEEEAATVTVASSLPKVVEPERTQPVHWQLSLLLPVSVLERFVGPLAPLSGSSWAANVYKCGDDTSKPHWAAWSPVKELNFHDPSSFGVLNFE